MTEAVSHSALSLLRKRFDAPAHVFLAEVRNATGFAANRSADGLAISIWPSRGLNFIGFEIKSIRSDWTKELANPKKADSIGKFCHYWWLVCEDDRVAKLEEIPTGWGYMSVKNGDLVILRDAPRLDPEPPTIQFVCAVFRRWAEHMIPKSMLDERVASAKKIISEQAKTSAEYRLKTIESQLSTLVRNVSEFEKASGICIGTGMWQEHNLPRIGAALKLISDMHEYGLQVNHIRAAATSAHKQADMLDEAVAELEAFGISAKGTIHKDTLLHEAEK